MDTPFNSARRKQRGIIGFKDVTWPLAIVRQRGRILLRRRGANGLLARLWELPGGEITADAEALAFLRSELKPLEHRLKDQKLIGEIRHGITDRRIRAPIYLIDCPTKAKLRLPNTRWRWINLNSLPNQAISSMTAKALKVLSP